MRWLLRRQIISEVEIAFRDQPLSVGAQLSALAIARAAGTLRSGRRAVPELRRWEAVLFWLLLAVVLLAPLPLGSNRPLPASALAAAVGSSRAHGASAGCSGARSQSSRCGACGSGLALVSLGAAWTPAGGAVHPDIAAPPVLE